MALKDLFDSDPRSKGDLRQVLEAQSRKADDLAEILQRIQVELESANNRSREMMAQMASKEAELAEQNAALLKNPVELESANNRSRELMAQMASKDARLAEREAVIWKNWQKYGNDGPESQQTVTDLRSKVSTLQSALKDQEQTTTDLRSKVSTLQSVLDELQPSALDAQAALHTEIALLQAKLQSVECNLKQQLDAAEMEIGSLRHGTGTVVWDLKSALQTAEKRVSELKVELEVNAGNFRDRVASLERKNGELSRQLGGSITKEEFELLQDEATQAQEDANDVQGALQSGISSLESNIRSLACNEKSLKEALNKSSNQLKTEEAKNKKLTAQLTGLSKNAAESPFLDTRILAWLLEEATPDVTDIEKGWLGSHGHGPWPEYDLKTVLQGMDYEFFHLSDPDLRHIIVGRTDWDEDTLLAQIESRSGAELRIYSQEMFIAMLATGRDPFDAGDPTLLEAFAADHPALEFLMSLPCPWPEVSDTEPEEISIVGPDDYGVSETPLHLMGYHVGVSSALSESERRALLSEFFSAREIQFSVDSSVEYKERWGRNYSAQRLYRMAMHIKKMADGTGRDWRKPQARLDWINDLRWLKTTYHSSYAKRFSWPDVSVG